MFGTVLLQSHHLTLVTCTDITVASSRKIHIVYYCLHSNHLHTTSGTSRWTVVSDWLDWTRRSDWTGLFFFFVSTVLLSTIILLFLLSSHFIVLFQSCCLGKHSCMSSQFSIAILNGTCSLRSPILFCGDVPAIQQQTTNKHQTNTSAAGWSLSAKYLHSAHRHGIRMTGWVSSCVCGHVYIEHHNFGVPVLTLSHILDITDIGGQWYTNMWYQSY